MFKQKRVVKTAITELLTATIIMSPRRQYLLNAQMPHFYCTARETFSPIDLTALVGKSIFTTELANVNGRSSVLVRNI